MPQQRQIPYILGSLQQCPRVTGSPSGEDTVPLRMVWMEAGYRDRQISLSSTNPALSKAVKTQAEQK